MTKKVKVIQDTYFKLKPIQSSELSENEKVLVKKDSEYDIHSDALDENDHVKIAFLNQTFGEEKRNTWLVFSPHIEIEGNEDDNNPNDSPLTDVIKVEKKRYGELKLPGYTSLFYLSDPIIPGGNFSWAEATHNGTRIPVDKSVVDNIIKVAKVMQEVREFLGNRPITINSWYRDPITNKRIGGASKSRHMAGDAVDFVVQGITPPNVNRILDSWWGARGGLASASSFTHIDCRGYKARWSYGF